MHICYNSGTEFTLLSIRLILLLCIHTLMTYHITCTWI